MSMFAAIINKLKGSIEAEVPRVFEAVFEVTLQVRAWLAAARHRGCCERRAARARRHGVGARGRGGKRKGVLEVTLQACVHPRGRDHGGAAWMSQ